MAFNKYKFSDFLHTNVSQVNTPFEWQHVRNLERLDTWLETFEESFGHPIIINSAYRTPIVNQKVGGAPKSYHILGLAVDFTTEYQYGSLLVEALKQQLSILDQVIIYYDQKTKGVRYVHVGLPKEGEEPRSQLLIRYK